MADGNDQGWVSGKQNTKLLELVKVNIKFISVCLCFSN